MGNETDVLNIKIEANASTKEIREQTDALKDESKATDKASKQSSKLKDSLTKLKDSLHSVGSHANNSSSRLGIFFNQLKRIAVYRAIRTALKEISKFLREGMQNLYNYSKEAGTAFAPAVDGMKNSLGLLKNSIATAFRPFAEVAIPVINQLAQSASALIDRLAELFSYLTGKTEDGKYTSAVYSDMSGAVDKAKELRNILLSFDELNRLGGGNEGCGTITNATSMFTQKDIDLERIEETKRKLLEVSSAVSGIALAVGLVTGKINIFKATGIVALFALLATYGDSIATGLSNCKDKLKEFTDDAVQRIVDFNNSMDGLLDKIVGGFLTVVMTIGEAVSTVIQIFADLMAAISEAIYKAAQGDLKGAYAAISDGISNVKKDFTDATKNISDMWASYTGKLKTDFDNSTKEIENDITRIDTDIRNLVNRKFQLDIAVMLKAEADQTSLKVATDQIVSQFNNTTSGLLAYGNTTNKSLIAQAQENSKYAPETSASSSVLDKLKSMIGLASGGVAYSPTFAMIGEYKGASSNPEIVAPQSILAETINSANGQLADVMAQATRQVIEALYDTKTEVKLDGVDLARSVGSANNRSMLLSGGTYA